MKHTVTEIKENDQNSRYTWAVIWDLLIVCYAPNKEWAEQIAWALDKAQGNTDDFGEKES